MEAPLPFPWSYHLSTGYWKDKGMQRKYLDSLFRELGYTSPEDWCAFLLSIAFTLYFIFVWCRYKLTRAVVAGNGGRELVTLFRGGVPELISSNYPEFAFLPWKFAQMPSGYWQQIANRRSYVTWLMNVVGAKSPEDLRNHHFEENNGFGLLRAYHRSPSEIRKSLVEDSRSGVAAAAQNLVSDRPEVFAWRKKRIWDNIENHKLYAEWLAKKLGILRDSLSPTFMERWYSVSLKDFSTYGGGALLNMHYKDSPYLFLKAVYPDMAWEPWRFKRLPSQFLADPNALDVIFKYVSTALNLHTLEQWHRISRGQLKELGVGQYFEKTGGLKVALDKLFPEHRRGCDLCHSKVDAGAVLVEHRQ